MVGAVALVATGVGAAAGAGLIGTGIGATATVAGISAGTLTSIGALASVGASIVGSIAAKKPKTSVQGDQTRFTANKDQGLPYPMGRTSVSGFIVHRQTHGTKNVYQTFFAVLAASGPIEGIEAFKVDGVEVTFSGGAALGSYAGFMWLNTQLGQTPEPYALFSPVGAVPGWDGSSKMSGYAGYAWTLKFDDKGKVFAGGVPEPSAIVLGVKCYDPRLDSTYPGGSGSCRVNDETTWVYSESPQIHGLTWLIGRHQNGKRVMGVGAPTDGIDVQTYVETANIAAANDWNIGGVVYSTDQKWDVLKAMLQAGGGEPSRVGATISCTINAPRVSLDTIRSSDLAGEASVAGTQSRRERINTVIPRYRSEAHDWEMVAAAPVRVSTYVTEDGGQRSKEIEFPLVQDAAQAAQLAAYEIVNAREFGPITLPLKPRWIGFKPGDCLTIDIPELNMVGQTALITNRSLDPSTGVVTLTLKSETAAKHDFALGRTANPPPTPSLQVIDPAQLLIPGVSAIWDEISDPNGTKPDDNADVTIENTAGNTLYVGPTPAEEVAAAAAQVATLTGTGPGSINYEIEGIRADLQAEVAAGDAVQNAAVDIIRARIRPGSPNLLPGGDFYDGLRGWNLGGDGWSVATGTFKNNMAVSSFGAAGSLIYRDVPAQVGVSYSIGAVMQTSGGTAQVIAQWVRADGSVIGSWATLSGTVFVRQVSAPVAAPTGTVSIRVLLSRASSSGVMYFAEVQVQEGVPTDFMPWANAIETAASITETRNSIAGTDAALASYQLDITARVGATEDVANGAASTAATAIGQISTLSTAVATYELAATQRIDSLTSYVRTVPNMLKNSDFKQGFTNWTQAGWQVGSSPSGGSFAYLQDAPANSLLYQDVAIDAGLGVSFGFESIAGVYMAVEFRNSGGTISTTPYYQGDITQRVNSAVHTSPAGTTAARVILFNPSPITPFSPATRVMLQAGAPTAWNDEASARELRAEVTVNAATLATVDGRTQAYWQVVAAVPGERTQLTISANGDGTGGVDIVGDVRISGDLLVSGTVSYGAMNVADFRSRVTDSDTGTYSTTTPGSTVSVSGINATLPNVKPDGEISFRVTANVSLTNAGGGSTSFYDSILVIRAADAFGGFLEYEVPLLQTTAPQTVVQRGDFDSTLTGACTVTAFIRHGSTNIVDGEPGIPDIKSVHIAVSNLTVDARWHW